MNRIYKMSDEAWQNGTDWDTAIYNGEIVTVAEFETYEEAVSAFEEGDYDPEEYGVE